MTRYFTIPLIDFEGGHSNCKKAWEDAKHLGIRLPDGLWDKAWNSLGTPISDSTEEKHRRKHLHQGINVRNRHIGLADQSCRLNCGHADESMMHLNACPRAMPFWDKLHKDGPGMPEYTWFDTLMGLQKRGPQIGTDDESPVQPTHALHAPQQGAGGAGRRGGGAGGAEEAHVVQRRRGRCRGGARGAEEAREVQRRRGRCRGGAGGAEEAREVQRGCGQRGRGQRGRGQRRPRGGA